MAGWTLGTWAGRLLVRSLSPEARVQQDCTLVGISGCVAGLVRHEMAPTCTLWDIEGVEPV